jgi:hypothetical protein
MRVTRYSRAPAIHHPRSAILDIPRSRRMTTRAKAALHRRAANFLIAALIDDAASS